MVRKHLLAIPPSLFVLFIYGGITFAQSGGPWLSWFVVASGGVTSQSVGSTQLDSVIGEPIAGRLTAGSTTLDTGFLPGAPSGTDILRIYLPVVLKNQSQGW